MKSLHSGQFLQTQIEQLILSLSPRVPRTALIKILNVITGSTLSQPVSQRSELSACLLPAAYCNKCSEGGQEWVGAVTHKVV